MLRDSLKHDARYEHTPVSLEQLDFITKEVAIKLNSKPHSYEIRPKKPQKFDDVFGGNWKKFFNIWSKYHDEIRKYRVVYSPNIVDTLNNSVCVTLFVRNQGYYGEDHVKEIILESFNVRKSDFNTFQEICVSTLGLKESRDMPHQRLVARINTSISSQKLRSVIDGPISHKDYDGAIRSATVLIETRLREKCVACGLSSATQQTGVDLATSAYHPSNGCLNPPWAVVSSSNDGAHHLFRGFFMYIRNAWGHRATVVGDDGSAIADILSTCQFLEQVVFLSTKR